METSKCLKCGGETYHNKGVGKVSKKPFENYKCKDKQCGGIEWVELNTYDSKSSSDEVVTKLDEILSLLKNKKSNSSEEISDSDLEV